ncbi:protein of unknown function DUF208 [Thermocrinis albus DSM 14484]|uniref:Epoxyqueuosine reductase QueH n=1 Tax=Thermocrinis albus (strain DSM 14484 / JCM 11386 / HI 11/12) TaxID=638303 RepID=D3SQI0_THEAH|nr:epoxyqueuosine reductase QueH [Thermocrinis albus]ADC89417.1 protein of unknown function DUF208 [Thermocrinis albus DSM 14484]
MKILVHICCAPDAIYFLKRLREDNPSAELVGFFYDPNIHPYEEYLLRLTETKRACEELGIPLYEGEYDVENWMMAVKGLEKEPERGERCKVCFDMRLVRTAVFGKEIGATHMTTTLLMSPKKDLRVLSYVGTRVAQQYGMQFLAPDYRKGGGTQEMFRLSREMEFYHQDYCGCVYALFQQKKGDVQWDLVSFGGRRPGSKEETLFIKEVRLFAETRSLPCREWEFSFLNWRVLQGYIKVGEEVIPSLVVPFSRSVKGILKTEAQEERGRVIFFQKGGLKVILSESLKDEPITVLKGLTDPAFRVPSQWRERLLTERVTVQLTTEIFSDTSRVLVVGDPEAQELIGIPADTLQDNRGPYLSSVLELIEKNLQLVVASRVAFVLLGAYSLGAPSLHFLQERLDRTVKVLPYDPSLWPQATEDPSLAASYS